MADRWARPHQTTILLDDVPRPVEIARLTVGDMANVRLCIRMLAQQEQRLATLADRPIREQVALAAEERDANAQLGGWVCEAVTDFLRPRASWVSAIGVEVTSGAAFCDAYDNDAILAAFWAIYLAQTVSETTRKNSPSPRDSADGSPVSASPARGDAPAATVEPASASVSGISEDAPAPPATNPSGTTAADSSRSSVLSAV